jgi:excisionase family DNA binding protein
MVGQSWSREDKTMERKTHFTVKEVSQQYRVSQNFVRRAIWSGALQAARFGRCVRIPVEEAARYARECLAQGNSHA